MHALLAREFYYPSIGGVQEVMRQIGERLAAAGHKVTVATTALPERKASRIRGVEVREFDVGGNLVAGLHGEVQQYRDFVLRQEYDILLIKAAQQWTFDALIPVLKQIRKPKLFIPCGFSGLFDPLYSEYFEKMPAWLREFDRLIFYASHYRDIDMARAHGLTNISIVSNGADEREFSVPPDRTFRSRYGIGEDAFVVMTVGTVTGLKGHSELAAAFEECDFEGRPACLLLVGNMPAAQGWHTLLTQAYQSGGSIRALKWAGRRALGLLGLLGLERLLGFAMPPYKTDEVLRESLRRSNVLSGKKAMLLDLPREEVIQAYLNSDLFVLASKIEYSPLVLFEAAAAGLPFLSVPVGNAKEIADWTGGGVVCDARIDERGYTEVDPSNLARQIELLFRDRAALASRGARGRLSWSERFSWAAIVHLYLKIFDECLQTTAS